MSEKSPEKSPEPAKVHENADSSLPVATKSSKAVSKKTKPRPARVQVDPSTVTEDQRPPQTGTVYNIWYNKWSGGDKDDDAFSQRKAEGRCVIERDSGYTRADKIPGSYFCLYFSRGLCTNGKKCEYLHRLPTVVDMFSPNVDCFGRDKFANYRDDMGGVGSFLRQNRVLYVGRVDINDDMDAIISKHFKEWGEIERIRILHSKGVAFVTYVNEANAQFAKEAMAHQSLDNDEVLNVRWATQDPDPMSRAREKRRLEEQAAEAIKKILPAEYVAELEGKALPDAKRRKPDPSFGLPGYEAPDEVWYARGENSVRPEGRRGLQAIEGPAGDGESQGEGEESVEIAESAQVQEAGSLISNSTLSQLKSLAHPDFKPAPKQRSKQSSMLVDYGSDED